MSRKTKAELEREIANLKDQIATQNNYIETLEYLHKHDRALLQALKKSRSKGVKKSIAMINELMPLRVEKHQQIERPKKLGEKKRAKWKPYLEIYYDLRKQGMGKGKARDWIQTYIMNKTGKKPPRSTIRNIFK